ncbi:carboxymuconolactone decarboxylase family protein [Tuberibacillus sp. Marseille-P3662]|uniref:carboxymuconolactone decarboxylase family protein n=1 Tax=Tuberibacillus sp. Marseille-P3662 TaxID=1965358 RepID=UPI000A1CE6EC|nr:carboxymuconolactone decarboxylase family protein [Tuberibacillus sp. Marseille-P3662]
MDILNDFKDNYGKVPEWVRKMNDYQPKALEYYANLQSEIMKDGAISTKDKELLLVGMNAARRYEKGMMDHTKRAIQLGATIPELVEILTPCILSRGIPAWFEGIKAIQYAKETGNNLSSEPTEYDRVLDFQDVNEALAYFKDEAGGVKADWVDIMEKDASEVLRHYGNLRTSILKDGVVPRKMKELVLVGINVAERYEKGIALHVKSAKKLGATDQEIAEVTLTGVLTAGIPAWFEGSEYLE